MRDNDKQQRQKRILAINDISCFGKCSITVVMPILASMGYECVPLPTAILSTHTGGFKNYTFLDMTTEIKKILNHWEKEKIFFDCVFTGYLGNKEQIDICISAIENRTSAEKSVIVDPVMADSGKLYAGFNPSYVDAMKKLCKKADIITPNYTEACLLSEIPYNEFPTEEEINKCFKNLAAIGAKSAVITGIKTTEKTIKTVYSDFSESEYFEMSYNYINEMLHGGGDVFSAVLCGKILEGTSRKQAVKTASNFTNACIINTKTKNQYGLNFEPLLRDIKKY